MLKQGVIECGWPSRLPIGTRFAVYGSRFSISSWARDLNRHTKPDLIRISSSLFCDHLVVEDKLAEDHSARRIVGTYRMQSGATAAANLGYYSEQEFDFTAYESMRGEVLELGRASIDRDHRTPEVLTLLWRGIAQYATDMQLRYLIGCSSLNSADPSEGWQMYRQLGNYRVAEELSTMPTPAFGCPEAGTDGVVASEAVKVPKLLKTYLAIGARICSAPAWDREFGTIDFLTLLDLRTISSSARNRFLAPLVQ